ncbi:hypothetical protein [Actinokineospora spheciospongiae]|uniref:hypothetical protein n=1 Tax=Actinokineospora spheciospongiae TaxID=909613 RepID=UPI0004B21FDE|nr:hypothetical protein [Actinokineospora spheciospongiae]
MPQIAFGVLLLALIPFHDPFGWSGASTGTCTTDPATGTTGCGGTLPSTRVDFGPVGVDPFDTVADGLFQQVAHPLVLGMAWLVAIAVGVLATRWWYRRGGHPTGPLVAVSVVGSGTLVLASVIRGLTGTLPDLGAWPERFALVALVAVAAFAVVRSSALSRGALGGLVALAAGLAAVAVHKTGGLWLIAVLLLALAVTGGSKGLKVVIASFTGVVLLANVNHVGRVFHHLGWDFAPPDSALFNGKDLLLPAAVLLIGGVVCLIAPRSNG